MNTQTPDVEKDPHSREVVRSGAETLVSGEEQIVEAMGQIQDIYDRVVTAEGLEPNSVEAADATNEAIAHIVERSTDTRAPVEVMQSALFNAGIETALELDQGIDAVHTPLSILEIHGRKESVGEIEDLVNKVHAPLPSGHEAGPLVTQAIARLESITPRTDELAGVAPHPVETQPAAPHVVAESGIMGVAHPDVLRAVRENSALPIEHYTNQFKAIVEHAKEAFDAGEFRKVISNTDSISDSVSSELFKKSFEAGDSSIVDTATLLLTLRAGHLVAEQATVAEKGEMSDDAPEIVASFKTMRAMIERMPIDHVRELTLQAERDPSLKLLLKESLSPSDRVNLSEQLKIAARLSGFENALDAIKSHRASPVADEDLARLLQRPSDIVQSLEGSALMTPKDGETKLSAEIRFTDEMLVDGLGLPTNVADDIRFSLRHESYDDDGARQKYILEVAKRIDTIGVDGAKKLREQAGLISIHRYSSEQLQRMLDVVDGNPDVLSRLQSGEVTVVISDAVEDWNKAFKDTGELGETNNQGTLFFEVNSAGDNFSQFAKHAEILRTRNLAPSRIVLAAHGRPGMMLFGDSVAVNEPGRQHERGESVVFDGDSGMSMLMDTMRPASDGYRHVVLQSCSQAAGYEFKGVAHESVAETYARNLGAGSKVYATEATSNIEKLSNGKIRYKDAGRVFVNQGGSGNIDKQNVDEF